MGWRVQGWGLLSTPPRHATFVIPTPSLHLFCCLGPPSCLQWTRINQRVCMAMASCVLPPLANRPLCCLLEASSVWPTASSQAPTPSPTRTTPRFTTTMHLYTPGVTVLLLSHLLGLPRAHFKRCASVHARPMEGNPALHLHAFSVAVPVAPTVSSIDTEEPTVLNCCVIARLVQAMLCEMGHQCHPGLWGHVEPTHLGARTLCVCHLGQEALQAVGTTEGIGSRQEEVSAGLGAITALLWPL